MKILQNKKRTLTVILASIFMIGITIMQSCSNDNNDITTRNSSGYTLQQKQQIFSLAKKHNLSVKINSNYKDSLLTLSEIELLFKEMEKTYGTKTLSKLTTNGEIKTLSNAPTLSGTKNVRYKTSGIERNTLTVHDGSTSWYAEATWGSSISSTIDVKNDYTLANASGGSLSETATKLSKTNVSGCVQIGSFTFLSRIEVEINKTNNSGTMTVTPLNY